LDVASEDGMWNLSGTWTKSDKEGDQKTGSWSEAAKQGLMSRGEQEQTKKEM
jgi:hypothetical protein